MTTQEFRDKVQKEYDKISIAKLINTGIELNKHKLYGYQEDSLGYCIKLAENSYEIFINPDITESTASVAELMINDKSSDSKYKFNLIKIVGGSNLVNIDSIFQGISVNTLDLSLFDTSNVVYASDAFAFSKIKKLILPEKILLNKLTFANSIFQSATILSKIEIRNIKMECLNMAVSAFGHSKILALVIDNVYCPELESIEDIFREAEAKYVYIHNIKVVRLNNIIYAFHRFECDKLTFGLTSGIKSRCASHINNIGIEMHGLFLEANIKYLDISELPDCYNCMISDVFTDCKIKEKIIMDSRKQPYLFSAFEKALKEGKFITDTNYIDS